MSDNASSPSDLPENTQIQRLKTKQTNPIKYKILRTSEWSVGVAFGCFLSLKFLSLFLFFPFHLLFFVASQPNPILPPTISIFSIIPILKKRKKEILFLATHRPYALKIPSPLHNLSSLGVLFNF